MMQDEKYNQQSLTDSIRTKWAGRAVSYYEEMDSTNAQAKTEAENSATHGTLVVANHQTAGRGRRGRSWGSPAGTNICMTLILRPKFAPEKASMLTLVMAFAVARGTEKTLRESDPGQQKMAELLHQRESLTEKKSNGKNGIKWPNDLVVNGKKVCGILTEMGMEQNRMKYVLIGVGINVHNQKFAPELADKATSIEAECGFKVSRNKLIANIMEAFEEVYDIFEQHGDLSPLKEAYEQMLVNKDREVNVLDPKGDYRGTALGITDTGELLVRRQDGSVEEVYAGEVSVRGIYGYV